MSVVSTMAENHALQIEQINLVGDEILHPNVKVLKNILGTDWTVDVKYVKKLIDIKKFQSLRNVPFLTNRIRVSIKTGVLCRKVLAKGKIVFDFPPEIRTLFVNQNLELFEFESVFTEGSNLIVSDIKLGTTDFGTLIKYIKLELYFLVTPENFFYFKFSNDNSLLENDLAERSRSTLTELSNDLCQLYKNQDLTDVEIKCGGELFKAHKGILSSRSPVFAAMFHSEMKESTENVIDIKDMDPKVLGVLLKFIYCGKVDELDQEMACGLLSAAEKYQLEGLKKSCVLYLQCAISADNVLSILSLADLHDENLKKASIDFVCKELEHLKTTDKWKKFVGEKPVLANEVLMNVIGFAHSHGQKLC